MSSDIPQLLTVIAWGSMFAIAYEARVLISTAEKFRRAVTWAVAESRRRKLKQLEKKIDNSYV